MTLADLSSLGSFLSGIAVLASLIFVGFQLRQNTQAVRATASQAHASNLQQIVTPIVENGEVARLWRLGMSDMESLTDDERVRFVAFLSGLFRYWESSRLQWRHGQLDSEHWENVARQASDFAKLTGVRHFWEIRRHWHSTEFQRWFESLPSGKTRGIYERPLAEAAVD